ncbi:MAG: hypothetical protein ACR2QM_15935 [Longimicrobiales bacterium]
MRARYQSKPRVAAFGIMLSLGLIFGANEYMQAEQVAERDEATRTELEVVNPMGASLDLRIEAEVGSENEVALHNWSC